MANTTLRQLSAYIVFRGVFLRPKVTGKPAGHKNLESGRRDGIRINAKTIFEDWHIPASLKGILLGKMQPFSQAQLLFQTGSNIAQLVPF